jgi:hypothetical protein
LVSLLKKNLSIFQAKTIMLKALKIQIKENKKFLCWMYLFDLWQQSRVSSKLTLETSSHVILAL